ncbi:type II secretion system protein [Pseudoxanthomonas sacheonensis]|uniref:General secretion pathway protein G n=1 Tax=Pseudoxanthomonas sacheonensis TaxID=443615 RepID=A0ABU1RQV1_9GAMM|nr:prepilin-type N-terminal cleavage/methylation domain-containing protein [Pseudoxanthomonas sacheonensis]MDR6841131.1 general secretion pathway protein G [Pseudoxanthomonas sacheonensis]
MRTARSNGFSLIELIVVIAIIAMLLVVALPRYQASIDRAELVALKTNLRALRDSIDRYEEDKGEYPDSLQQLVESRYLKSIPVDPITDSAQTWMIVEDTIDDKSGVVDIRSGAKGATSLGVVYAEL